MVRAVSASVVALARALPRSSALAFARATLLPVLAPGCNVERYLEDLRARCHGAEAVSAKRAAELLGVSCATVCRAVAAGELRSRQRGARSAHVIPLRVLAEWLAS